MQDNILLNKFTAVYKQRLYAYVYLFGISSVFMRGSCYKFSIKTILKSLEFNIFHNIYTSGRLIFNPSPFSLRQCYERKIIISIHEKLFIPFILFVLYKLNMYVYINKEVIISFTYFEV